jgi:hypothetical protein
MKLKKTLFFTLAITCFSAAQIAFAAEKISLRSPKPDGSPRRVTVSLEVGGHLKVAADKKTESVPMSVVAQFGYDEQRLDDGSAADNRLAVRWYDDVRAVIKAADQMGKPQLREGRQLIAVSAREKDVILASPNGPLTRDELDLIEIPANTLILDELLPQDDVEVGHKWKPSDTKLARLLLLDAVAQTDVECRLVDVQNDVAEITIDGPLSGATKGVASQIELKGKLTFDVKQGIAKSLVLAIKEDRGVGFAAPGVDVVAKLKISISPLNESKLLTGELLSNANLPQSDEPPPLEYVSKEKGYRFEYDRRWHFVSEAPERIVMRLVDRGDLVAQCNIMPATKNLDRPIPLDEFQADVQKALGQTFGQFEHASEASTQSGLRMLRVVAAGTAETLPIQWRYYTVHDKTGRDITVVFTMEAPLAEQFKDQDRPIVESIEFIAPELAGAATATKTQ